MNATSFAPGHSHPQLLAILVAAAVFLLPGSAFAQLEFETGPIDYHHAPLNDSITKLQKQINSGQVKLRYDDKHGYLPAVLEQLKVPESSQMLVFSKTSFQLRRINPRTPRAVYFGDDAYVGWCQDGDVVELSVVDPKQGAVFYALSQEKMDKPQFTRDRGQCLICHASSRTSGVPGHLVRSVYTARSGQPHFGTRTYTSDHSSPMEQRWGGWYVSGTHGKQRHMGNVLVSSGFSPEKVDVEAGANVTDLSELVDVEPYLTRHSDIVSLMVLEHQSKMHNLITRASYECRSARHYDQVMNDALDRPSEYCSDTTKRRIASASIKLVEYMLFVDELALTDPVAGTSRFTKEFGSRGPHDCKGRSLRQFDLTGRIMKHPCSYLIYSAPFDNLPDPVKKIVYRRLFDVLTGKDQSETFAHLSTADRTAIFEILRETKKGLPDYWQ